MKSLSRTAPALAFAMALATVLALSSPALAQQGEEPPTDDASIDLDPEHGLRIVAPHDLLAIELHLLGGLRGQIAHTDPDGTTGSVEIRYVRARIGGHLVHPSIRHFTQLDFAAATPLLDFHLSFVPSHWIGIRAGQYLQPFGISDIPHVAERMFPESAPVLDYWGLGRDTGAMLFGGTEDSVISWEASVAIGSPVTLDEGDTPVRDGLFVARLEWCPFGEIPDAESPYAAGDVPLGLAIGANGYYGHLLRDVNRYDPITTALSTVTTSEVRDGAGAIDARLVAGPVSAAAQVSAGHRQPVAQTDGYGGVAAMAQVGVFVWDHVLEVGARGQYLDPSFELASDLLESGEVLVSVHPIGANLSIQLRYIAAHQGPDTSLVQLRPGWTHVGTLQTNAYF